MLCPIIGYGWPKYGLIKEAGGPTGGTEPKLETQEIIILWCAVAEVELGRYTSDAVELDDELTI